MVVHSAISVKVFNPILNSKVSYSVKSFGFVSVKEEQNIPSNLFISFSFYIFKFSMINPLKPEFASINLIIGLYCNNCFKLLTL